MRLLPRAPRCLSPRVRAAGAALALAAAVGMPAAAQTASTAVDLQLVLAVDVSGSVNQVRFELQRDGYVAAFRHPHVLAAIRSGPAGAIAVTVTQWTGPALQFQVVPWTRISDAASAEDFAAAIERAPRQLFGGGTSISGAIDHAMSLWRGSPFQAARRVIDVSGDGANNRGRPAAHARDEAVAAGAGINGLPILALEPDLDRYYEQNVIGGPGAFMVVARSYEAFSEAVRRKLIIEIAGVSLLPACGERSASSFGCEPGEGRLPSAQTRGDAPSPDFLASLGSRPLPASGER
jgi:Protein of unknown function (DUF1194)